MSKTDLPKKDLFREKFHHELSEENKIILVKAFVSSCKQILYSGQSIFLENFGILSPQTEKKQLSTIFNGNSIARQVKIQNITFQKCSELTSFVREKNQYIAEEKEFSEIVFSRLNLNLQIDWRLSRTREYLAGLIQAIKHDAISQGISKLVSEIGDFYTLHNRQGYNLDDWYAGANIIFISNCDRELSCEECKAFERPVLQSSWELMACLYGKAIHILNINIYKEIKALGFDLDRSYFGDNIEQESIQVAIFANKNSNQQQLIYCSEGLRNLTVDNNSGNEFVFQVAYDADFRDSAKNSPDKLDDILLPTWPKTVLLMGWIMLQNSKSKSVKIGTSLSFNTKLCDELEQSKLTAVLSTPYALSRHEQLSNEKPFTYVNLLGITHDEYRLAENHSPDVLYALLKSKRSEQVTKLCRPNLLTKTTFLDLADGKVINSEKKAPKVESEQSFAAVK